MPSTPTPDVDLPTFLVDIFQTFRTGSVREREVAAEELARIGPVAHRAIPDLVRLLGHTDPYARLAAGEILMFFGPPAVNALVECLRSGEGDSREGACATLGLMGPDALVAVPALEELVGDDQVGPWAARALESICRQYRRWRVPGKALFTLVGITALALAGMLWLIGILADAWGGPEILGAYAVALLGGFLGAILGGSRWGQIGAVVGCILLAAGGAFAGLLLGGILIQLVRPAIEALGG